MRRRLLVVIGAICCIGVMLAIFSTVQHFRLARQGFENESFCVISEKINCDLVNGSSYSEVFGVPVAWWGMIYYGALAFMSFLSAFSKRERRQTVSIAWFMAMAGIPYCLYLAYIAYFVIGAVCVECIGMYLVNLFAAVALFFALKLPIGRAFPYVINYARAAFGGTNRLGFRHQSWSHVIAIGAVFGIGWLIISHIQAAGADMLRPKATVDELIRAHYAQSIHPIKIAPEWAVWGNPKAKVKLIEFSEFQCPFCRLSSFLVKPYLQEFHKDIAYYFVNYPLDSECNAAVPYPMHPAACYLSKAGICANKQDMFWEYHDELFRNQRKLNEENALDIAEQLGLNRSEFKKCIDSSEIAEELKREIDVGRKIYLNGTPALFLNGRKIKNWRNKKYLQTLVKKEIKKSR